MSGRDVSQNDVLVVIPPDQYFPGTSGFYFSARAQNE